MRGRLYDLGEFPAAVPDPAAPSWVHGVAVPVPGPDDLAALDMYEGYEPRNPDRSLFVREVCAAELPDGRREPCWMYAYRRPVGGAPLIPSGRYGGPEGGASS